MTNDALADRNSGAYLTLYSQDTRFLLLVYDGDSALMQADITPHLNPDRNLSKYLELAFRRKANSRTQELEGTGSWVK